MIVNQAHEIQYFEYFFIFFSVCFLFFHLYIPYKKEWKEKRKFMHKNLFLNAEPFFFSEWIEASVERTKSTKHLDCFLFFCFLCVKKSKKEIRKEANTYINKIRNFKRKWKFENKFCSNAFPIWTLSCQWNDRLGEKPSISLAIFA